MNWYGWAGENWPGFLDKRPKWFEAMNRLETEYGPAAMDKATERFADIWPRLQSEEQGIGNRPPTFAEWRAMLGGAKGWERRHYPWIAKFNRTALLGE